MEYTIEEAIKKFEIPIETKPMDSKTLGSSSFVLVRHGLSEFNYSAMIAADHPGGEESAEFKKVQQDSPIDPGLHEIGQKQCEAGQAVVNSIDWKVVFTSPMQRAMETTVEMYKNHPNKDNIKFIVLPIVREVLHTVCDIAQNCDLTIAKFGEGQPAAGGLKFDFSRMFLYGIPELWQIYTLANVAK